MIIGLTGYAQSGKDTVASILVEKYGFKRVAFADKIRDFLYGINPMVACSPTGYLQDLVNLVGWDKAKQEPQVRRLLQDLGVSARELLAEDIWVSSALKNVAAEDRIVVTDVRFENEAAQVKLLNGQLWRVKRLGFGPVNNHVSESELDGHPVDQIFVNNGTVEDLEVLITTRMRDAFPE
jgi:cytidylate kinase